MRCFKLEVLNSLIIEGLELKKYTKCKHRAYKILYQEHKKVIARALRNVYKEPTKSIKNNE